VEVLAPGIELDDLDSLLNSGESDFSSSVVWIKYVWMTGLCMKEKLYFLWTVVNEISTKRQNEFGNSSETVRGCCWVISMRYLSVLQRIMINQEWLGSCSSCVAGYGNGDVAHCCI
jgi:hypothetical protein